MAIVSQQGLPFTVGPTSPERVQLWASCAGHASTREDFHLVSSAFNAFWYEASVYYCYQRALERFQLGYATSGVSWLDSVVSGLRYTQEYWGRVVHLISDEGRQEVPVSMMPWFQDAMQQVQSAMDLRLRVATQIAIWCDQYQQVFPEHTQAFFTELQAKGV